MSVVPLYTRRVLRRCRRRVPRFFFFNDTATTEIYTLSLHDALPISSILHRRTHAAAADEFGVGEILRSEEHTSELQSRQYLVCRLLLEKKNQRGGELPPGRNEPRARGSLGYRGQGHQRRPCSQGNRLRGACERFFVVMTRPQQRATPLPYPTRFR